MRARRAARGASGHGDLRRNPPPTRRMARASSPPHRTRPRGSGMRAPGRSSPYCPAMGLASIPPPTRPTARASSPRPATRPRGSGMRARGAQLAVLSGHDDCVNSAAYSPDGTRIVTASWDRDRADLGCVARGHSSPYCPATAIIVESAAYSPDGTRIVTASEDKTARIWDARTGTQLAVLVRPWQSRLFRCLLARRRLALSPGPLTRPRGSGMRAPEAQLVVLSGHGGYVNSAAYSPDGTRIVTASDDKTARIWDARTGDAARRAVRPWRSRRIRRSTRPTALASSPPRMTRPHGSGMHGTGVQLAVLSGHDDVVNTAVYSPDGTRIVTASYDKTARIWDAGTGVQLAVLSGHDDVVSIAAFSPDGTRILTASGNTARVWDGRVPANIAAQILWDSSAETDPLPQADRTQLGLLPDARVKKCGTHGSACDQAAAAFYDPDRLAAGLAQKMNVAYVARSSCSQEIAKTGNRPPVFYQAGRTLLAKSDVKGARLQFDLAVSKGYRAARIDLANLTMDASAGRAASLYQDAWQEKILRLRQQKECSLSSKLINGRRRPLPPSNAKRN